MSLNSEINGVLSANKTFLSLWQPALDSTKSRNYLLQERQISEPIIKKFGIHYTGTENVLFNSLEGVDRDVAIDFGLINEDSDVYRNCLVFPFKVPVYNTIAFGFRRLNEKQYINSVSSIVFSKDWTFYGMSQALPKILEIGWIILVEGYFDVLRMHQLGFTNTVGVCGTAISELKTSSIRRFGDSFILFFDSDEGGVKAKSRALKQLKALGVPNIKMLTLPQDKSKHDPDSFGLKFPEKLTVKLNQIMGNQYA